MRTDLVRLLAMATLVATSGCGGSGASAPSSTNGAQVTPGAAAGLAAAAAGALAGAAAQMSTGVTCTAFPCTVNNGYVVNVTLPASFTGITASATLQEFAPNGYPPDPPAAIVVVSGAIKLSAPAPANGSPTITITYGVFPLAAYPTVTEAIVDGGGATETINGTENTGSVTIPSLSTYVWPATATTSGAIFTIYVM
jgi:hypothetical protein